MVNDIQKGAEQFAIYLTENIPQTSRDKVKYYLSGSLAMLLLSISKKIKPLKSDSNGNITFDFAEKEITGDAKSCFKFGVRPLSIDIDLVEIKDADFSNENNTKIYNLTKIKDNCPNWYNLCPSWHGCNGTMYVDVLSDVRGISSQNIAVVELEKNKKILIANPIDLMFHKFAEMCLIDKDKNFYKYEKDCKDLSCLYNGLTKLNLLPENTQNYLTMMTKANNFSAVNNLLYYDYSDKIKQIFQDSKKFIEPANQKNYQNMISEINKFNEHALSNLYAK